MPAWAKGYVIRVHHSDLEDNASNLWLANTYIAMHIAIIIAIVIFSALCICGIICTA